MKQTSTAKETQESPARSVFSITPADDTPVNDFAPRALYVGVGGDLSVIMADRTTSAVFQNVPSGSILPIKVYSVQATGTTASGILGLY